MYEYDTWFSKDEPSISEVWHCLIADTYAPMIAFEVKSSESFKQAHLSWSYFYIVM